MCRQVGTDRDYAALSASLARLTMEYSRTAGEVSREILRHLLAAVLLEVDRLPAPDAGREQLDGNSNSNSNVIYTRFCAELETSYTTDHRVEQYAGRLGYTVRTLTRACQAATGRTAKQVIDARIILQAQRLLAHTDDPVSSIAHGLGFGETTNFSKFFTRLTGTAPGDFRLLHGVGGRRRE